MGGTLLGPITPPLSADSISVNGIRILFVGGIQVSPFRERADRKIHELGLRGTIGRRLLSTSLMKQPKNSVY